MNTNVQAANIIKHLISNRKIKLYNYTTHFKSQYLTNEQINIL